MRKLLAPDLERLAGRLVEDQWRAQALAARVRDVLARDPRNADVFYGVLELLADPSLGPLVRAILTRECSCAAKAQPCSHVLEAAARALRASAPGRDGVPAVAEDGYHESRVPARPIAGRADSPKVEAERFERAKNGQAIHLPEADDRPGDRIDAPRRKPAAKQKGGK